MILNISHVNHKVTAVTKIIICRPDEYIRYGGVEVMDYYIH